MSERKKPATTRARASGKSGATKSVIGTTNTAVDAKGLCDIIKVCHKSGVSRLKFGDVEVTFGVEQTPYVAQVPLQTLHTVPAPTDPREALGVKPVSMELASEQQHLLEDAELVDMHVSDPIGYENYAIDQLVHSERSLDG